MRKESVQMVRGAAGVVGFPEDVVDTYQTDPRTANDPCAKGITSLRVNVTRKGVRAVPVDNRQNKEKRAK